MDREDITERIEIGARLAREAYPGPWRYDSDEREIVGKSGPGWYDRIADNGQTDDTGEFIAHWNPEFALELVREVERLRRVEEAAYILANEAARTVTEPRRFHENEQNRQQLLSRAVAKVRTALANPAAE